MMVNESLIPLLVITTFRLLSLPTTVRARFFLSCRVDLKRMPVPGLTQWLDVTLRKKVIESSLNS